MSIDRSSGGIRVNAYGDVFKKALEEAASTGIKVAEQSKNDRLIVSITLKLGNAVEKRYSPMPYYKTPLTYKQGFSVFGGKYISSIELESWGYKLISDPNDIQVVFQRIPVQVIVLVDGKETYNKWNMAFLCDGKAFTLEPQVIVEAMMPYSKPGKFESYTQDLTGARPILLHALKDFVDEEVIYSVEYEKYLNHIGIATIKLKTSPYKYNWTGTHVTNEFLLKVESIASQLRISPDDLMAVMAFESWLDPSTVNSSGATGLIQFVPSTARGLGTTTVALSKMSAVEQMDYVYAHLKPFVGRMYTLGDIYMAVLWPSAVGETDDYVLWTRGSIYYSQNNGLDVNNDGAITKSEATQKIIDRRNSYGMK